MNQKRLIIFICGLSLIFYTSAIFAKKNEIKSLDSIKTILSLKTGRYDTSMAKSNFTLPDVCEPAELDVELIDMNGQVALTIGPKLVFSNLQATETVSKVGDSCEYKILNKIEPKKLTQKISQICSKKESNYLKNRILEFKDHEVIYMFEESPSQNKKIAKKNICVYSLMTAKENTNDKK